MRRAGGIPPIVTVLITIAAVVSAALVAWFFYASTRGATTTPVIEVTQAYASGNRLCFTVRNLGSTTLSGVTLNEVRCGNKYNVGSPTYMGKPPYAPGEAFTVCTSMSAPLSDGESCMVAITIGGHAVTLGFKVTVP